MQGAAWVSHLSENLGVEGAKLQTATKGAEEMQKKLNSMTAERDKAMERANNAEQALAVERSLKDQFTTSHEEAKKELQARLQAAERERKAAEELAKEAQVENFRLGYDDAVALAKKLGFEYKRLLLNPAVDTTFATGDEAEGGDETPEPDS